MIPLVGDFSQFENNYLQSIDAKTSAQQMRTEGSNFSYVPILTKARFLFESQMSLLLKIENALSYYPQLMLEINELAESIYRSTEIDPSEMTARSLTLVQSSSKTATRPDGNTQY